MKNSSSLGDLFIGSFEEIIFCGMEYRAEQIGDEFTVYHFLDVRRDCWTFESGDVSGWRFCEGTTAFLGTV